MATIARESTAVSTVMTTSVEASDDAAPTVSGLLVALDTCSRQHLDLVNNTLSELLTLAEAQGSNELSSAVRQALLIAFKRRNHDKSQAEGEGAGEKSFFQEVLLSLAGFKNYDELLISLIPLIPLYGSWRDVRTFGEEMILREISSRDGKTGADHPVYQALCNLFAEQLVDDEENAEDHTPSNACKYAPHEHRYGREEKEKKANDENAMDVASSSSVVIENNPSLFLSLGRDRDRKPRKYIAAATHMVAKFSRIQRHNASSRMAKDIARIACPAESAARHGAAAFRKLRAKLNKILVEKGYLIEPLMSDNQFDKIDFAKASKSALSKYKASMKKHRQMERWQAAMKKDIKAVPDLDSLAQAVVDFREEEREEDPAMRFFPLRVQKARLTMQASHKELLAQARKIMRAAQRAIDGAETAVPLLVAVDAMRCSADTRTALVLAAYLLASAQQGVQFVAVNGALVSLQGVDDASWASLAPLIDPHGTESAADEFIGALDALLRSVAETNRGLLEEKDSQSEGERKAAAAPTRTVDMLFLCESFTAYEENQDHVLESIANAQRDAASLGVRLRSLRVHRLRAGADNDDCASIGISPEDCVLYVPRPELRNLPQNPADVTVDLVFVVDFTGSMGAYMDAVKTQLVRVISTIRDSVRLKRVRVALVGYRDFRDARRVVKVDFHEATALDALLAQIAQESADGGDDCPEDLLSGLVAASQLSWGSHVRLQVIITDANAHGFQKGGDHFPSGRCPDQLEADGYPSLGEITRQLAEVHLVDTFFCQLNNGTVATQHAMQKEYLDGRGFGTIVMGDSSTFAHKIIAAISKAVLSTVTKQDVQGVQTFDGLTVSSLTASLNSSLRETLRGISVAVNSEDFETLAKAPPTDWERLQSELATDSLNPVRLALGLQVSSAKKLSNAAQYSLFKAGVTVDALQKKNYPEVIVEGYQKFLLQLLSIA